MCFIRRRHSRTGHPGFASRAGSAVFLALALTSAGTLEEARATPNARQPLVTPLIPDEPASPGAASASNLDSNEPAGLAAETSGPATNAEPAIDIDSWHARAIARLSAVLKHYEAIAEAGGWTTVPDGPTLKPGMVDARVPFLRQRLKATGDVVDIPRNGNAVPVYLTNEAALVETTPLLFDATLEAGVRAFQARHGLYVDGVVGRQTLEALNVPVAERVRTLKINRERVQNFNPWGEAYVLVIVPGFEASLIRDHEAVLSTRVVVGQPSWPTPQLNGMISRIVVNPYWNVPKSILRREIIPRMQRDPGYLAREGIRVFSGWHTEARELDPAAIDWSGPAARIYRLRQDPGPKNALGSFKFTFNNSQSIYLHDTQARRLFNRSARALSHGCVRVERPFELAELLLEGQGRWNGAALKDAMSSGSNRWIILKKPIPVHLVYWTAWADENGRAQFRNDIYKRDWKPYARQDSEQQGT